MKNQLLTAEANRKKLCLALYTGISKEAWNIITDLARLDLPVFQLRELDPSGNLRPISHDPQTLTLLAALRDGEQGFYKKLDKMRREGETLYSQQQ